MTRPSRTECEAILGGISAYLDGELPTTECAAIERHCEACPECAAVVAGLRQTIGLCRDAASLPLPDQVRARAQASIRRVLDGKDGSEPK